MVLWFADALPLGTTLEPLEGLSKFCKRSCGRRHKAVQATSEESSGFTSSSCQNSEGEEVTDSVTQSSSARPLLVTITMGRQQKIRSEFLFRGALILTICSESLARPTHE